MNSYMGAVVDWSMFAYIVAAWLGVFMSVMVPVVVILLQKDHGSKSILEPYRYPLGMVSGWMQNKRS